MSGEIVNLRTARKRRKRENDVRRAEENRQRHGRTSGQKERDVREEADRRAHLDAHRLSLSDEK